MQERNEGKRGGRQCRCQSLPCLPAVLAKTTAFHVMPGAPMFYSFSIWGAGAVFYWRRNSLAGSGNIFDHLPGMAPADRWNSAGLFKRARCFRSNTSVCLGSTGPDGRDRRARAARHAPAETNVLSSNQVQTCTRRSCSIRQWAAARPRIVVG